MVIPFTRILLDRVVLRYLGNCPVAVRDCLIQAFRKIRDRELTLEYLPGRDPPFYTRACGHLVVVSLHTKTNTVVILDAFADAEVDEIL